MVHIGNAKKELTPAKLRTPGWVCGTSACYASRFPRAAGVTARAYAQFANAHPHAERCLLELV
jgi:hypothetical protein